MKIDCIVSFLSYNAWLKTEKLCKESMTVEVVDINNECFDLQVASFCNIANSLDISNYNFSWIHNINIFNIHQAQNKFTLFATKTELIIIGKQNITNNDKPLVMIYINQDNNKDAGTQMKAIYNQIAHKHQLELTKC